MTLFAHYVNSDAVTTVKVFIFNSTRLYEGNRFESVSITVETDIPDRCFRRNLFQLILGNPQAILGQRRYRFLPVCPGFHPGASFQLGVPEDSLKGVVLEDVEQMRKHHSWFLFSATKQQLDTELFPDVLGPHNL